MKKFLLCVLLTTAVAVTGFAGGQKGAAGANGTVTLTGYMQIDPADPQYAYWGPTLDAFTKAYPNIKLDFEYVTGEQFHDKFQTMAASGQIPDLFTCYAGARSSYLIDRGLVKDLRPYLTDAVKAKYNSAIWQPQGKNGEIYIVSPNMAVCTVVYANPAVLSKLGLKPARTMAELTGQVAAIRGAGLEVMTFGNNAQWPGSSILLSALVERTGGTAWFDKAMSGAAKFSDKPFVDALAVIKQMMDSRILPAGVNQLTGMNAITEFVNGKAAYMLQSGWSQSSIKGAADPAMYAQIEPLPFPDIAGDQSPGANAATLGEALAMGAKLSKEKADAAWTFLSFIYGEPGMDLFMKAGEVTTYKLDLSKYDIEPLTRKYIDMIGKQKMGYVIDAKMDGEGVNNVLNAGIQAVMIGDKTPQQVATEYETWVAKNDSNRKR
jgi:raffinose/stachyose/melibiose transport system substrate-binding protein